MNDDKPANVKRNYVVLECATKESDVEMNLRYVTWLELGTFEASSESAAKRQAIIKSGQRKYGALVAVARWNPTTPTARQRPCSR